MSNKIEPTYANWLEAIPFTIIGEMPEGNKTPPKIPAAIVDAKTAREVYGDGSFGGPYRVSDAVMRELFAGALEDILHLLKFE